MEKWMNVVLDLNGLQCVTEDMKSKGPGKECNHYRSHRLSRLAPRYVQRLSPSGVMVHILEGVSENSICLCLEFHKDYL